MNTKERGSESPSVSPVNGSRIASNPSGAQSIVKAKNKRSMGLCCEALKFKEFYASECSSLSTLNQIKFIPIGEVFSLPQKC